MSNPIIFGVAATMLTGMSPMNINYYPWFPVVHTEHQEPIIEFETVQQFIDKYCSVEKIEWNEETQEEIKTLELITEITEDNYGLFLEGYGFYLTFDEKFQNEISNWYIEQEILQVEEENEETSDLEEPVFVTYQSLFEQAIIVQDEVLQREAEEQKQQEEIEKPQIEEVVPEVETKPVEVVKPVEKTESTKEVKPSETKPVEEVKPMEESKPVEPQVEEVKPIEKPVEEKVAVAQVQAPTAVVNTVLQKPAANKNVQAFVNAYVSNSEHVIYRSATIYNYQQIISGLPSWNKMSASDKKEINAYLKAEVGKSYQVLLQEAQSVQFTTNDTRVPTAATSFTGFYASLCASSFGLLGYLLSKYKRL